MTAHANKQIVRDFLGAVAERDRARVDALLVQDGDYWFCGESRMFGRKDKGGFLALVEGMWSIVDGPAAIRILQMTAEEDRVSATAQGEMITTKGVPYRNTYHILATVADGRIVGWHEYFDTKMVGRVFAA